MQISSSFLQVPLAKEEKASEVLRSALERVSRLSASDERLPYTSDYELIGVRAEWSVDYELPDGSKTSGIWIYDDEEFNPDHAEMLARILVEELEIDEPFVFSWSFTSRWQFGGGAMAIIRGKPTVVLNANVEYVRMMLESPTWVAANSVGIS
jgi:hypothetical protein